MSDPGCGSQLNHGVLLVRGGQEGLILTSLAGHID